MHGKSQDVKHIRKAGRHGRGISCIRQARMYTARTLSLNQCDLSMQRSNGQNMAQ
jgi:hypothetical protein